MNRLLEIEPFAVTFAAHPDRPLNVRLGLASKAAAEFCKCEIDPHHFLGQVDVREGRGMFTQYNFGVYVEEEVFRAKEEKYPELAEELRALHEAVKAANTQLYTFRSDYYQWQLHKSGVGWAGGWIGHANPDYDLLLHVGTDGLREKIARCREENPHAAEFYEGCELFLDAVNIYGDRLQAQAAALAQSAESAAEREIYARLAQVYTVIPRRPAFDMCSAVQMFWLAFTFDGVDSPGRLDQFFSEYWRASDPEDARLWLDRLWQRFHETRTWNLCISGSDEHWVDQTNEVTYAVLDLAEKYRYQTPNITLRLHRNSPEKLWRRAVEVIATGIGMPALYNDEVVCPALEKIGIPPEDSHLYCMNGCNQIDIMGKSHMGLEDGDVNFGKCLELALHDGVDSLSGKQVSIHTGDATKFTTYEQLLAAFYGQMDFVDDTLIAISNSAQMAYAEFAPSPWRSCLIAGCLEKGQDYKNGGPLYGDAQFLSFGMPETADSLAAIKKYVFEEKRFTMAEVVDALRKDFEGYEELYNVLSRGPKFGNDDPYVDSIMTEITDHWFAHLKAHRTFRGGVYTGGCSTFTGSPGMGKQTGALPCGHRAGEASYSDSINAELGQDRRGPTAAIKSALSYDQTEVTSGFVMQLRFEKKLFATEKGQDSFLQLAKSYFQNGGQQLSINVLSAEELLDAQLHPEKYGDLVVRVGGYSDYFTRLNKDLQDNIIARTSH